MSTRTIRQPVLVGEMLGAIVPGGHRHLRVKTWLSQLGLETTDDRSIVLARCDSGAETRLLWEFAARLNVRPVETRAFTDGRLVVEPQATVRKCYVDLLVSDGEFRLGVEVDGHEWHQRSEEQVQFDYLRQRRLTASGLTIVRFTAREVFSAPAECWRQVEAIMEARRRG